MLICKLNIIKNYNFPKGEEDSDDTFTNENGNGENHNEVKVVADISSLNSIATQTLQAQQLFQILILKVLKFIFKL